MQRIISTVTNDISTDMRVQRICRTLQQMDNEVIIVGRKLSNTPILILDGISLHRFRLIFNKGPLFYMAYNIRLFIFLCFQHPDIVVANDVDTLLASFAFTRLFSKKLIFDSHELFSEVPELQHRPRVKSIWCRLENHLIPKINYGITVCDSIAKHYKGLYDRDFLVIRNVPDVKPEKSRSLEINDDVFKLVYIGALNQGRGVEHMISCVKYLSNVQLTIVGNGDIDDQLRKMVFEMGIQEKVSFLGRQPGDRLVSIAAESHLGLSLEENLGLNYYYALPNKLFTYIHAGLPVLVADFPEMAHIVNRYKIGQTISDTSPQVLAKTIDSIRNNHAQQDGWRENLHKAAEDLNWAVESMKLRNWLMDKKLVTVKKK